MKKKKVIAWVSSLVVIIGLCVLLSFTFFSVKEVELDFRTSKTNITATDEEIIEASGIKEGGTIFFRNKAAYAENIESEFAYINVINIESVFPSKLVVHLAEREEVYAVKGEDNFYICDEELRVLRVVEIFESDQSNAMLLTADAEVKNLKVGQYITQFTNPKLYQSLFANNRTLAAQKSLIKQIDITKEFDEGLQQKVDTLKLKLHSGQTVTIANYMVALSYKTHLMMEVYSSLFDMADKDSLQEDGSLAPLTLENLKSCEIYINNYYTQGGNLKLDQENCYFKIFVAQSV
ncbi:MAG: FtsQ-type POTRA domain-containing protein [Clostridia bacterium]|nr:FtsQ-type POTRA domain-containing protein [Clostridia bacterium]